MKIKAEIGVMHLQAKKCQRLPANHEKLKEKPGTDSLIAVRRNQPCRHPELGFLTSRAARDTLIEVLSNWHASLS